MPGISRNRRRGHPRWVWPVVAGCAVVIVAGVVGAVRLWPRYTGPGQVVTAYFEALNAEDQEGACALLSSGTLAAMDGAEQAIRSHCHVPADMFVNQRLIPLPLDSSLDRGNIVDRVKVRGNRAEVRVLTVSTALSGDRQVRRYHRKVDCIRERGVWKVDFEGPLRRASGMFVGG